MTDQPTTETDPAPSDKGTPETDALRERVRSGAHINYWSELARMERERYEARYAAAEYHAQMADLKNALRQIRGDIERAHDRADEAQSYLHRAKALISQNANVEAH